MAKSKDLTIRSDVTGKTSGRTTNNLNVDVEHMHVHQSELRELTRLAEINPDLADKVLDQRENQSVREDANFRIGLIATLALLMTLIFGVVFVVVYAGIAALALTVFLFLATALLLRVILTGEWSETSWIGSLVKIAINAAGGRTSEKNPESDN
jgi:hypothetical protein